MSTFYSEELHELTLSGYVNYAHRHPKVFCDLLITDKSNTIYAASLIGVDAQVKQATMLMQAKKNAYLNCHSEDNTVEKHRVNLYSLSYKLNAYQEEYGKMDGLTHAFLVAENIQPNKKDKKEFQTRRLEAIAEGRVPERMPEALEEMIIAWDGNEEQQIYDVLNDRYHTPMLPEWKNYLIQELKDRGLYKDMHVYSFGTRSPIKAGLLSVTEDQLEQIISEGVQGYELEFAVQEDGRLFDEGILPNLTSIDSYLSEFASDLGARIQKNIGLRFNPDTERHHPAFHDINLEANHNGITGLYPPQANTVMGVARTLKDEDHCFIVAEMG